jgi:hypothetical protein
MQARAKAAAAIARLGLPNVADNATAVTGIQCPDPRVLVGWASKIGHI